MITSDNYFLRVHTHMHTHTHTYICYLPSFPSNSMKITSRGETDNEVLQNSEISHEIGINCGSHVSNKLSDGKSVRENY